MPRPADIVSPIKDQMLPPKTSVEEARRDGRNHYETEAAMLRMANAGAQPVTTFALACEPKSTPCPIRSGW